MTTFAHPFMRESRLGGDGQPSSSADATHQRLLELTAILATGIHRLRRVPPVSPECPRIPSESSFHCLDECAQWGPDGAVLTTGEREEVGDED